MKNYICSDLAVEWSGMAAVEGVSMQQVKAGVCDIRRIRVHAGEGARRLGRPAGRYVTVECGELLKMDSRRRSDLRRVLAVELCDLSERMCGRRGEGGLSVMVAGLGNREITPDALGPETARRLVATRHLKRTVRGRELSVITPGVAAQTGIETVELVRGAVQTVHPDLVIAVDALAAREVGHLGGTVQISDTGISPGSGLGDHRKALNAQTVGVPVMALGVPTVVGSSVLVCGALQRAGYGEISEEVRRVLEMGRAYFVSPKEIDLQVAAAADLLAGALERAFGGGDDLGEQML